MMYGNRVLRRAELNDQTIRDAIVPLGADPIVVIKVCVVYLVFPSPMLWGLLLIRSDVLLSWQMARGESEDLCSVVANGKKPIKQAFFQCLTCDFVGACLPFRVLRIEWLSLTPPLHAFRRALVLFGVRFDLPQGT
jgi:hypothetical protein